MSGERCERCDKVPATQEDHDDPSHPGGCTCDECCSKCWGNGVDCSPVDWRSRCLAAERERDEAVARAEMANEWAHIAIEQSCVREEIAFSDGFDAARGVVPVEQEIKHRAERQSAVDEWRRTRQSKEPTP